jgi:glycosyltransferase involved in cell wall biosynthesis
LKILHVIHSLDPRSGGPSHALCDLARAQIDQGNSVSIISTDRQSGERWDSSSDYLNTIQISVPKGLKNLSIIPCYGRRRPWVRYAYSPKCGSLLHKVLSNQPDSSEKPDFVHVHGLFSQITQKATEICRQLKIPYAIRPTGALDELPLQKGSKYFKKFFLHWFLKKSLENAAFIHSTSEKEAKSLDKLGLHLNVQLIPLGVSFPNWKPEYYQKVFYDKFSFLGDNPIVLCLSRIHPIKRLDLALKAFAILITIYPDCQLVIAGNPSHHQQDLLELARNLHISDQVHFMDFLQGDLKTGAFFSASVFLQTSEHENFGITVMEALVHGLRVVCTEGVATGKHVESNKGGLVVHDTPEAIANGLQHILKNHPTTCDVKLARRVNEIFSWDSVVQQLKNCYKLTSGSLFQSNAD